jgi:RHS repeat-associated protein
VPYGEERWTGDSSQPTDFTFTGQRNEAGFGLMDYNARYYSPVLGRFVSPDTIVPRPGNPQSLNRCQFTG